MSLSALCAIRNSRATIDTHHQCVVASLQSVDFLWRESSSRAQGFIPQITGVNNGQELYAASCSLSL